MGGASAIRQPYGRQAPDHGGYPYGAMRAGRPAGAVRDVRCGPHALHPRGLRRARGGRPVVALESTIIAHGLPRPENLEIARAVEEVVREEGATPATIADRRGDGADRARPRGPGGDRRRRRRRQVQRARPLGRDGAPRDRRDHRRGHRDARRPRRHRRVRHRRHRRRAPRGARQLGRVGRPDHARPDPDHARLRGREVDPRRRGHARAPGDAERHAARLPDRPLPRLLPRRLGLPGAVARRFAGGGRRRRARARGARTRRDRRRQPDRAPARPRPARPGARPRAWRRQRARASAARTSRRTCSTASTARRPARAWRRTCGWSCATPRWPRRSPAPWHDARRPRRPHGRRHRPRRAAAGARQRHAGAA